MAKLYFSYSAMNAGKSTLLLQASHNYRERGMPTLLMTASLDDRAGVGRIGSRIGINDAAYAFQADETCLPRYQPCKPSARWPAYLLMRHSS